MKTKQVKETRLLAREDQLTQQKTQKLFISFPTIQAGPADLQKHMATKQYQQSYKKCS